MGDASLILYSFQVLFGDSVGHHTDETKELDGIIAIFLFTYLVDGRLHGELQFRKNEILAKLLGLVLQ